jgi:hypothetical protein
MKYRTLMYGAIAITLACWGLATGLAIEKVVADGVSSYTLLFAMPVLTLAIGWLIHQGVSDLREFAIFRGAAALALGVLALGVTLPNSIGSSGGAKDTAVAEAEAANRGISFASGELAKAEKDLEDAKQGVLRECVGAPAVIDGKAWPKCQWWRRQVEAHTLAVTKYGTAVVAAPVAKQALSGETRIAWALQMAGASVTEKDVQMAQPMALPIAAELLCAFFMFMAFEFGRKAREEMATAAPEKAVQAETPRGLTQREIILNWQQQADLHVPETMPSTELFSGEQPDPTKPRKSKKRSDRKDRVIAKIRAQTLAGKRPSLKLVTARYRLPKATAHRYMVAANAEAKRALN